MSTPSTGAPQPRDTAKDEDFADPVEAVEAVEAVAYEPVQSEKKPDDDSAYQPADQEAPNGG